MLNFSAICPDKWKRGLIFCLLNIAKRICSNDILFNQEVDKLRHMFKMNGYPLYYFNRVLERFLNPPSINNDNNSDEDVPCVLIKIPYIGDQSYNLSKKLKKLFEDANNCKVRIVFTSFKLRNYFSLKAKTPKCLLSNVIYKFTCQGDPGVSYIGETKRHLITRMKEHLAINNSYRNSEVKTHIINCQTCCNNVKYDSFKVIKKCQNSFNVLIHEALLIRRHSPSLNKQLFSNGSLFTLKIFS